MLKEDKELLQVVLARPKTHVVQYVRKVNKVTKVRRKKGVLVAFPLDNIICIGFSYCNNCEEFSDSRGKQIAFSEAIIHRKDKQAFFVDYDCRKVVLLGELKMHGITNAILYPIGIRKELEAFIVRISTLKRFKSYQFPKWVSDFRGHHFPIIIGEEEILI